MAELRIPKGVSQEEVEKALALFARVKANTEKRKAMLKDPAVKAKLTEKYAKARMRNRLLVAKAIAAGIAVSDAEVAKAMAEAAASAAPAQA